MDSPAPLRLALLWHDTVITERRLVRGPATVGEALDNTLTLPPAAINPPAITASRPTAVAVAAAPTPPRPRLTRRKPLSCRCSISAP